MKRIAISLIIFLVTITSFAQNQKNQNKDISHDNSNVYELFSTQNIWTFIKLNTRNGQMWQVQWDTAENQLETPISLTPRVLTEEEKNGRFFLYPTQNIYNFILMDQIDGRTWQVQWSTEFKKRMVIRIN